MKRIIGLILALVMSIGIAGTCFAADADLKSMSVEELISLRDEIIVELNEKLNPVNDTIGTGTFLVGRDIKAGVFNLTQELDEYGAVKIYASEEDYTEGKTFSWENPSKGTTCTANLKDGMVIELVKFTGSIVEQTKPSWAP